MANELKMVFGSPTTVISSSASITTASNTTTSEATQLDNSSALYPYARAVLGVPDGLSGTATLGTTVDLFMIQDDIDGTSDETPIPASGDIEYLARYVGSWLADDQSVAILKPITISLAGVQKARFFIKNNFGVSLVYSSNPITVKVTPFTYAPT